MEKYPRGRRGSPAKGVVRVERSMGSNPIFSATIKRRLLRGVSFNMESYRSGHNGAVLKTVRRQRHRGSNPLLSATQKFPLPLRFRLEGENCAVRGISSLFAANPLVLVFATRKQGIHFSVRVGFLVKAASASKVVTLAN